MQETNNEEGAADPCGSQKEGGGVGGCNQQLFWVDQLTAGQQCGGLAVWAGDKFWIPCGQEMAFVCVAGGVGGRKWTREMFAIGIAFIFTSKI